MDAVIRLSLIAGMKHCRGILLFGPPGTGKTLMARQIGTMLNAREPKIVNGPQILDKYVGESEANIRKLFAEAEEEEKRVSYMSGHSQPQIDSFRSILCWYKEKYSCFSCILFQLGPNSGLHIIIFDEIDAICKARGSVVSTNFHRCELERTTSMTLHHGRMVVKPGNPTLL